MLWLHFGEIREVTASGGKKEVGDWAIHVQCPWRVCKCGRVVVAYHDFYYDDNGDALEDWDIPGQSRFDSVAAMLCAEFEAVPPIVTGVEPGDVGGFSTHLSQNYRLDVFPDTSLGQSEHRRLFQPALHAEHFVVSSDGAGET
jgi:hypothetical protein